MNHAEKCPVCGGVGAFQHEYPCHGCDGKGWVSVADNVSGSLEQPLAPGIKIVPSITSGGTGG